MYEVITSLQNPQVKTWRSLNRSRSARLEAGLFLAEGEHMAGEALKQQKAQALLIDQRALDKYDILAENPRGASVYVLAGHVMEALSDAKSPQGVIAVCAYPAPAAPCGNLIAALNGVQDPGNVGTVIRTLDAAGFSCLLTDEKTADPYGPKALRASMGGVFRVPCVQCPSLPDTLEALRNSGFDILAGDLRGEDFFSRRKTNDKVCIVIGNEGQGISPAVMEKATLRLRLPIPGGAESLNAAVAAGIMIYDVLREKINGSDPFRL